MFVTSRHVTSRHVICVYLSVFLFCVCVSVCLFCVPVCLSAVVCVSVCLFLCVSVCPLPLSVCLPPVQHLLSRSLPVECVLRLWDTYFSCDEGYDLHIYACLGEHTPVLLPLSDCVCDGVCGGVCVCDCVCRVGRLCALC